MKASVRSNRRSNKTKLLVVFIAIVLLAGSLSPAQGEAIRELARSSLVRPTSVERSKSVEAGKPLDGGDRAAAVTHFRLCPRRLSLYVDESYTLSPLPLSSDQEVKHGVPVHWETSDKSVATVSSWGEVSAVSPGNSTVTVQAGTGLATVAVEVRNGVRPKQTDLQWDLEHSNDCDEPESSQLNDPTRRSTESVSIEETERGELEAENIESASGSDRAISRDALKRLARPAVLNTKSAPRSRAVRAAASKKTHFGGIFPLIDPDGGDTSSPDAARFNNAVGSPRFTAQESSEGTPTKTKRQLGSYNYLFTAPVISEGGRGVGVNLALNVNSRLWNKDGTTMTFNYNKGWPAAGWTLGYGRIIENYDNTAIGNNPGNRLVIQPDGTRIHFQSSYYSSEQVWKWDTNDGTFIHMSNTDTVKYPDGSVVKYDRTNNRLLPASIKNSNGDLITIAYRDKDANFPYRWAIDHITDSLGRVIQFKFYGDTGYPADPVNGKPQSALAAITAPDIDGTIQNPRTRTLVQIEYQDITLKYDFGSMTVVSPGNNSILTVVKRIYYPQTGRGYLLLDYSTYGMPRKVSVRKDMTGPGGAITDGTQIAYTTHNYTTIDPNDPYGRNQVGALNDSAQYTERREWWQDKTDDNGNPDSSATPFTYSRSSGSGTETDTTGYPNGLQVVTTTDTNTGSVSQVEYKNGGGVLRKIVYTYTYPSGGGTQIGSVETFDEANTSTRIEYEYESYGRVKNLYEYGYKSNGTFKVRRRTRYSYSNSQAHLDASLLRLVTEVRVYDGLLNNNNDDDALKTDTVFTYDDYAIKGGMEYYGLIPSGYPPNHDSLFDQNNTTRGNVTGVQTYSAFLPDVSTTRYSKYDIFGNVVQADVSCCQVKNISFNSSNYYSQPVSVTSGTSGVIPFLTTSYQYDFNTGLLKQITDPSNLNTYFVYDNAWRLYTVTSTSGAITTTAFDKDLNQNDQLAYREQVHYTDTGSVSRDITSKSWFDGAGHVLRSGTGAGSSPTNFDTVATVYNRMGRVLRGSNPYSGDSSGIGTGQCTSNPYPYFCWTTNSYDLLSRVAQVSLPDGQTVITTYAGATSTVGATVTVTDQVGRQRKSESDGLGRLVKVTEPDTATGVLSWETTYSYDVLDNLKQTNQGGQTRSFSYDALSRLISQTTPEGGTVSFAYWDFDAIKKKTDPRNVETHYKYDSLNRLSQIWYTGLNGLDDPNATRPPLPTGVAATADVITTYNNFPTAQVGNGQVSQITDGPGSESYLYDSVARVSSKTRAIGSRSYQTQYQYNTANQLTVLIYPSGKRVRTNHDTRGRMNGLDKVDAQGNFLASYMTSVGYNTTGQVASVGLVNGVSESYGYSPTRLQLTSQSATKSGNTLMSLTYGHQAAVGESGVGTQAGNSGQLMSITGSVNGANRDQTFKYDNVGRLVYASGNGSGWQRRYTYDRWGNRTKVEQWAQTQAGFFDWCPMQFAFYTRDGNGAPTTNRMTEVDKIQECDAASILYPQYDGAGNETVENAMTCTYDGESRMTHIVAESGGLDVIGDYSYDAGNRRLKKAMLGGLTTHYVWEGSEVIAEYNGSTGALLREYIYAGSSMVVRDEGGVMRYYHQDRLSTRVITDASGGVKGTMHNEPFGEDGGFTGETEKHRFTSYERDEGNTDYAMNRQYETANGRFMRPDPIGGSIGIPQSLNRYSYVGNDPINSTDSLGLAEDVWALYRGTFIGGGGGFGFGGADNDFWGYRIADLPGFGTTWGSLSQLEEWRYGVLVATGWHFDPAFPANTDLDDFDPDELSGGPLWNNATGSVRGRLEDIVRQLLASGDCSYWFEGQTHNFGIGVKLADLFKKTGLNFYTRDDTEVSLGRLGGLNTTDNGPFNDGSGFGQTLSGGTSNPQVVINRYAFKHLNNLGIATELIHEMFHAAGLRGSQPKGSGFLGLFRPNDLNPEVKWADIEKHCGRYIK